MTKLTKQNIKYNYPENMSDESLIVSALQTVIDSTDAPKKHKDRMAELIEIFMKGNKTASQVHLKT